MRINGDTFSGLQAGAKAQIEEARQKLDSLQRQASRALRHLATQGQARRSEWTKRVRRITSIRELHLDKLPTKLIEAAGIATSGQVHRINRELAKLAKKVESISAGKSR
jgi:chromosome segregation ATPase